MKRITLLFACLAIAFAGQAQFKIGPSVGIPVGDLSDFYSFTAGADVYYMFGDPDALVNFGAATGFINYFGKDYNFGGITVEGEGTSYIPVAAAGRVTLAGTLIAGADAGYGISLDDSDLSGFYWRLVAGIDIANAVELNAYYHSVKIESTSISTIGAALLFEF